MKKAIVAITIIALGFISNNTIINKENGCKTTYILETECIIVNESTNETYCKDNNGNVWCFICDDSYVGDKYLLTMNNNHTKEIADDKIVKVKYIPVK